MRTAFLFPGQGSHRAGMASAWLPEATERFAALSAATGLDLPAVADDRDACGRTAIGQPAIHATSLAALDALTSAGITPDVVAGHSLGEVTAAVAAGALSPDSGAQFVAERGRAMGAACEVYPGTMAVVLRLPLDTIELALQATPSVRAANVNAPGQTVVAGPVSDVEEAITRLEDAGGRIMRIDVEGAFHTPAMASAMVAADLALKRMEVTDPIVPLVTGRSGEVLTTGAAIRTALVEGILAPVQWVDVQRRLVDLGIELAIEVGSVGTLAAMARRTVPDLHVVPVATPDDLASLLDRVEQPPSGGARGRAVAA
jgi:[acyl-carrier-protein] S-malonyltransferase